jgi:hypothetical protein
MTSEQRRRTEGISGDIGEIADQFATFLSTEILLKDAVDKKPILDLIAAVEINKAILVERKMYCVRGFAVLANGTLPDNQVDLRTRRRYGVVSGSISFNLVKGQIILPTGELYQQFDDGPWEKREGNIYVSAFDVRHHGETCSREHPLSLMVYTGPALETFLKKVSCPFRS